MFVVWVACVERVFVGTNIIITRFPNCILFWSVDFGGGSCIHAYVCYERAYLSTTWNCFPLSTNFILFFCTWRDNLPRVRSDTTLTWHSCLTETGVTTIPSCEIVASCWLKHSHTWRRFQLHIANLLEWRTVCMYSIRTEFVAGRIDLPTRSA